MSSVSLADASLINDTQFLEELTKFQLPDEHSADPGLDSRVYIEAIHGFDALERGLPVTHADAPFEVADQEGGLIEQPHEPRIETPRSAEARIPLMAAALVLLACLTLGAATAALVFHDQFNQITAPRSATR